MRSHRWLAAIGAVLMTTCAFWEGPDPEAAAPLGIFTDSVDVGTPSTLGRGSARFDADRNTYTVAGGGENMWGSADHFHYVWKKVSGDVMLEATAEFVGTAPGTGTPAGHRKACLVLRQTLDPDAVYADAAAHGDGLTSLQWRDTKGGVTRGPIERGRPETLAPREAATTSRCPSRGRQSCIWWSARVGSPVISISGSA